MRFRPVATLAAGILGLTTYACSPPTALAAITPPAQAPCSSRVPAIDVSRWQGTINWPAVAQSGIRAAWVKVSGSDGGNYHDSQASTNLRNAPAAGVAVGTYHFADDRYDPTAQADFAIAAGLGTGPLPPTIDFETNPARLSPVAMDAWVLTFAQRITSRLGRVPAIYTGAYLGFGNADHRLAAFPLWIANYGSNAPGTSSCNRSTSVPVPNVWTEGWTVWQHNSTTHISGISGAVDVDAINPAAFSAWVSGVDHNYTLPPTPAFTVTAGLSGVYGPGSRDPYVSWIQRVVGVRVDGDFGPVTYSGVIRYQRAIHVPADGVWGPTTQRATDRLFELMAAADRPRPAPAAAPSPSTLPVLRIGARGNAVSAVQRALHVSADGVFGPRTLAAVLTFQRTHRLIADGIVGPATHRALGA